MGRAAQYRQWAMDCRRHAAQSLGPNRDEFQLLADQWERLARRVDDAQEIERVRRLLQLKPSSNHD